jgi:hypothetical protein
LNNLKPDVTSSSKAQFKAQSVFTPGDQAMTDTQTRPRARLSEATERAAKDALIAKRGYVREPYESKAAALSFLQRAGIFDKNGNYTKPYRILAEQ